MAKKRTLNKGGKKGLAKLNKITKRAKTIYNKKGNRKKWTTCIKEATASLKKEKKI